MKKVKAFILMAAAVAVFAGCASTKQNTPRLNKVYVTNTTPVDLLPVTAISEPVELYQYFEGDFGQQKFASTLYLSADSQGITVLMLNDMMIEVGSIVYDGQSCTLESGFFPKNLKPEYIVLDLQNAYADDGALKNHYEKYGLDFETSGKKRSITKKGDLIEEITFEENVIRIINHLRGYTYTLINNY